MSTTISNKSYDFFVQHLGFLVPYILVGVAVLFLTRPGVSNNPTINDTLRLISLFGGLLIYLSVWYNTYRKGLNILDKNLVHAYTEPFLWLIIVLCVSIIIPIVSIVLLPIWLVGHLFIRPRHTAKRFRKLQLTPPIAPRIRITYILCSLAAIAPVLVWIFLSFFGLSLVWGIYDLLIGLPTSVIASPIDLADQAQYELLFWYYDLPIGLIMIVIYLGRAVVSLRLRSQLASQEKKQTSLYTGINLSIILYAIVACIGIGMVTLLEREQVKILNDQLFMVDAQAGYVVE